GVLTDGRRPHRYPRLALARAAGEIGIGRGNQLAEPCAALRVAVHRVAQLIEGRHVETKAGGHAERRREPTEIRGLPTDGRRVKRRRFTQPCDAHLAGESSAQQQTAGPSGPRTTSIGRVSSALVTTVSVAG